MAIAPSVYTMPRRIALVRVWRHARRTHGVSFPRAAWIAARAAACARRRRTVRLKLTPPA